MPAQRLEEIPIPAAVPNRMDRLSDFVGRVIPGGYRLPSRHPLKVSLVMGLLGLVAGWGTVLALSLASLIGPDASLPIVLSICLIPIALVMFVFYPLMAWQGQRLKRTVPALVAATIACAFHLGSFGLFNGIELQLAAMIFAGAVGGFAYGAAGLNLLGGTQLRIVLHSTAMSAAVHFFTGAVLLHPRLGSMGFQGGLDELMVINLTAGLFGGTFIAVGIALGQLIWDHTPRPKFEPPESTECPPR